MAGSASDLRLSAKIGVSVNYPSSETYSGYNKEISRIEVPEAGADFYAVRDVPSAEVRAKWHLSETTAECRRAFVYTPPDYDTIRSVATQCLSAARSRSDRAYAHIRAFRRTIRQIPRYAAANCDQTFQ